MLPRDFGPITELILYNLHFNLIASLPGERGDTNLRIATETKPIATRSLPSGDIASLGRRGSRNAAPSRSTSRMSSTTSSRQRSTRRQSCCESSVGRDVKHCSTTLHFEHQGREVHPVGCDENGIIDAADEGIEFVELLLCECGSNSVIRL